MASGILCDVSSTPPTLASFLRVVSSHLPNALYALSLTRSLHCARRSLPVKSASTHPHTASHTTSPPCSTSPRSTPIIALDVPLPLNCPKPRGLCPFLNGRPLEPSLRSTLCTPGIRFALIAKRRAPSNYPALRLPPLHSLHLTLRTMQYALNFYSQCVRHSSSPTGCIACQP